MDGRDEPGHDELRALTRGQHDRIFDLARVGRSGCDRGVGGFLVSASSTAGASVKDLPILKLEWLIAALFAH